MQSSRRTDRRVTGHSRAQRKGKKASFRDLKAFGLWSNRADLTDPVQFTDDLRARMERPIDAR